jgi:hypothetical protein
MSLKKMVQVRFRHPIMEPERFGEPAEPRASSVFNDVLRAGVEHEGGAFFITQYLGRGSPMEGGRAMRVTYFPADIVQSMVVEDE